MKAVTGSAGSQGLALGIGMIGSVLLTRALGVEGRGLLAWIMSLTAIAAAVLQFGMGQANRRFVAEDASRAGDMAIANIIFSSVGAVVILPLFAFYALKDNLALNNTAMVLIGLGIAPLMAISINFGDLLLGLHKNKYFNIYLLTQKASNALLIVVMVLTGVASPIFSIVVLLVSFLLQTALALYFIRTQIKNRKRDISSIISHLKSHLVATYISNLLSSFAGVIIPILLASMHSVKAAGLFAASMILIDAARSSIRMVGLHIMPRIVRESDITKRKLLIRHGLGVTIFFGSVAAVILYVTSGWLLPLLFGAGFIAAVKLLQVLAIGLVFSVLFCTMLEVIAGISTGIHLVVPSASLAVSTCLAAILLIPTYGAMGGAVAFVLGGGIALVVAGVVLLSNMR